MCRLIAGSLQGKSWQVLRCPHLLCPEEASAVLTGSQGVMPREQRTFKLPGEDVSRASPASRGNNAEGPSSSFTA